ncbi:hypothetical protein V2J09_015568 [Rumex salicifolius]
MASDPTKSLLLLFDFINLDFTDSHFELAFSPTMATRIDSSTSRDAIWHSPNLLIMSVFSIFFNSFNAFDTAFMAVFFDFKYLATSLEISSSEHRLLKTD